MDNNEFDTMLAVHRQATQTLIYDFKNRLSVLRQNQVNHHIEELERQIAVRQEKCKKDYEEGLARIEERRKGKTSVPLLRMYDRAEESLRTQCEQSLSSIEEICRQTIANLQTT